jgi:hypothetical protein
MSVSHLGALLALIALILSVLFWLTGHLSVIVMALVVILAFSRIIQQPLP